MKKKFEDSKLQKNYNSWIKKIEEAQENNEYLEPYPPEMRREFWKHNLNPITGMPTATILATVKREADSIN